MSGDVNLTGFDVEAGFEARDARTAPTRTPRIRSISSASRRTAPRCRADSAARRREKSCRDESRLQSVSFQLETSLKQAPPERINVPGLTTTPIGCCAVAFGHLAHSIHRSPRTRFLPQ